VTLPGIEVDPGRGDVDAVRDLARLFQVRADALTGRAESGRAALGALDGLESLALDELRARVASTVDKFGRAADAATETSGILGDYAATLDGIQFRARWLLDDARSAYDRIWWRRAQALNEASEFVTGWALDWDEVLPSWLYLDDRGYLLRWQGAIDDYRDARARLLAIQGERDDLDSRTASSLRGIGLLSELAPSHGVLGRAAAAALWAGDAEGISAEGLAGLDDPELIRQVWNGLGPEQQAALIAAAPLVIGNLNGIPLRDRIAANRINIRDEITAREARIDEIKRQKADALRPAYTGKDGVAAVYDGLIAEQQSTIDYYESLLDQQVMWRDEDNVRHTDTGARVVVFDPRRKAIATYQGAIDPVTGDIPSWVQNVAVSVPGMETRMTSFNDDVGRYLYEAAGRYTAVFQWAGGEFPGGGFPQGTVQAMDSSYAERLAPRLRDFAAAIQVPAGAELTVVGHSYGGATVGLAETAGLTADRIMYVSAAGMGHGVDGLQDFPNTKDVPHYALMARDDLVVGPIQGDGDGMHGRSPLNAEGVIRLETGFVTDGDPTSGTLESYDLPEGGMPAPVDAHSTVLTPRTGAFQNVVAVITGGRAELFAPDQILVAAGHPVTMSGIEVPGYEPHYVEVN
jgi:hypothetical protein